MGEVYRGRDPRIGREVAIKLISPGLAGHGDRLQRFEQEARTAGSLSHPNLVTIYELGMHEGAPFIAMELLEGATLRDTMGEEPLSPRKAVAYAAQIAHGLAAAHEKGIIHRDLKPENIFVTPEGRVKILDFGLAKLLATKDKNTKDSATMKRYTTPGTVMGTAGYMSPEQVRAHDIDHRSDIFSLGAILYEMLSGRRAFERETSAETMTAILKEEPAELPTTAPHLSPALDRIVRHCLEKSPQARFQSARDLAFDLEAVSLSSGAVESPGDRFSGRRIWPWMAAVLAGMILGFPLGMLVGARRATPSQAPPAAMRPLTSSGQDAFPTVSPDGRLIAFSSTRDGRARIWLKQLDGEGELALTAGPDIRPRFSPDGSTLLFVRGTGPQYVLYRVPVLGGEPRKIADRVTSAEYSPDGRQIAFTRSETGAQTLSTLAVINPDGSQERVIATWSQKLLADPRWSPDGTWIAVSDVGFGNFARSPQFVSVDGKLRKGAAVDPSAGIHSSVLWLDNNRIVYGLVESATNVATGAGSRIVLQDLRSGKADVLLYSPGAVAWIDGTRDGRLVVDSLSVRQNIREVTLQGSDGGRQEWISRGKNIDRQPAYSPDGQWITFSSNRSGNLDIWAISTINRALRRLTDHPEDEFDPAFTPDGKHLLWSSRRTGNYEIWMAEPDGTAARQLTRDGVDAENATASPDGKWIVYTSYDETKRGLWKIGIDGSGATRIVADHIELPELSPDGRYVSYHPVNGDAVRVVRLADGARFDPIKVSGAFFTSTASGRSRWTTDGKSIAFTDTDSSGLLGVYVQDFIPGVDTTATRRVIAQGDLYTAIESFGFSPDGKKIALSYSEQTGTILASQPIPALTQPVK